MDSVDNTESPAGAADEVTSATLEASMAGEKESQSLIHRTAWSATASLIATAARLAVGILLSRHLGPDGMGKVVYFVWVADMAQTLTCFGLPTSLVRYPAVLLGARRPGEAASLVRWIVVRCMVGVVIGAVALFCIGLLPLRLGGKVDAFWVLAAVLFVSQSIAVIYRSYLTGQQRFAAMARLNVWSSALLLMGAVGGALLFGEKGALAGYVVGEIIGVVAGAALVLRPEGYIAPDSDLRRRVWEYSLYIWFTTFVASMVWSRVEIFFLNSYWNAREVATFTTAVTLSSLVSQTALLVMGALVPHFAGLAGTGDRDALQRSYSLVTRLTALVLLPLSIGCAAIAHRLVPLLFGPAFAIAIPASEVMALAAALLIAAPGNAVLYATERSKFLAVNSTAGALLAIGTFSLLIPRYGAIGAVWGRFGAQAVVVLIALVYQAVRLELVPPLAALARTALAAALCGAIAYLISRSLDNAFALPLAIAGGAGGYVVALKVLRGVSAEDIPSLRRLLSRLPVIIARPLYTLLEWVTG